MRVCRPLRAEPLSAGPLLTAGGRTQHPRLTGALRSARAPLLVHNDLDTAHSTRGVGPCAPLVLVHTNVEEAGLQGAQLAVSGHCKVGDSGRGPGVQETGPVSPVGGRG